MAQPASTSTSERTLRIALALAGLGAALVLVNLLGLTGRLAGLAAMVAGVVLSAPHSGRMGSSGRWWEALAAGTVLTLAGIAVSIPLQSIGGLLAVAGAILVAVAVALCYPAG